MTVNLMSPPPPPPSMGERAGLRVIINMKLHPGLRVIINMKLHPGLRVIINMKLRPKSGAFNFGGVLKYAAF